MTIFVMNIIWKTKFENFSFTWLSKKSIIDHQDIFDWPDALDIFTPRLEYGYGVGTII